MLQNRKRSNGADNAEEEIVSNTTGTCYAGTIDEDMIVCDILSRIPAKSLMRFKCVSKPWCSLIKDPYFIDLHYTRSKILQRFFFVIPLVRNEAENQTRAMYYQDFRVCLKTTGFLSEVNGRMASIIPITRNLRSARCNEIIGAVNGLICFVSNFTHGDYSDAACIYNISTREITPWIISTVLTESKKGNTCCYIGHPTYCFGYDPATKKYKVMCMWNMSQKQDDGSIVTGPVCEVLTVGHNSWRKIEAAPPRHFPCNVSSAYVNGSIYWFPDIFEIGGWNSGDDVFMVAFDVGSEKFRTIQISKFRSGDRPFDPDPPLDPRPYKCYLLEVNGCVALLRRIRADIVKLWIYKDIDKESTYKATTMMGTDWTENIIACGTDKIILETHIRNSDGRSKAVSIYSYDLKKKIFEEIKISGIPLSVSICFDSRICTSFCESLVSLSEA